MDNINKGPFYFIPFSQFQNESYSRNKNLNNLENTLKTGNTFINEYKPYKNYQPYLKKPRNNKEQMMEEIQMYDLFLHDLKLHLDIYPNDKEIFDIYYEYQKNYDELLNRYNSIYSPIEAKNSLFKNQFNWLDDSLL